MLGQIGETSLSIEPGEPELFGSVPAGRGETMDRIADLARFLLDGEVGVVDLRRAGTGQGVFLAPRETSAPPEIADPATALKLGFASQASVPVRIGEDRIGTLAVVSKEARTFDGRDIETLRRLAELIVLQLWSSSEIMH